MPKFYVFMQKDWHCMYRAICQCGLDVGDSDIVDRIAVLDEDEEDICVYITFLMILVFIYDKETLLYVFLQ